MLNKNSLILFQGDSITDAGRDKRNYHDVGPGYPKYATEILVANHPEIDFEFTDRSPKGDVYVATAELRAVLGNDISLAEPEIQMWLSGYLEEQYGSLNNNE